MLAHELSHLLELVNINSTVCFYVGGKKVEVTDMRLESHYKLSSIGTLTTGLDKVPQNTIFFLE